jgi:hypothetical protein
MAVGDGVPVCRYAERMVARGLSHQEAPQADGEDEAPQAAEEDADPAQEQEVALAFSGGPAPVPQGVCLAAKTAVARGPAAKPDFADVAGALGACPRFPHASTSSNRRAILWHATGCW